MINKIKCCSRENLSFILLNILTIFFKIVPFLFYVHESHVVNAVGLSSNEKSSVLVRLLCNYFKINANSSTVKSGIYVTTNCGIRKCDIKQKLFLGSSCNYLTR